MTDYWNERNHKEKTLRNGGVLNHLKKCIEAFHIYNRDVANIQLPNGYVFQPYDNFFDFWIDNDV